MSSLQQLGHFNKLRRRAVRVRIQRAMVKRDRNAAIADLGQKSIPSIKS